MFKQLISTQASRDPQQHYRPRRSEVRPQGARAKSTNHFLGFHRRPSSSYSDSPVFQYESGPREYVVVDRHDQRRATSEDRGQTLRQRPSTRKPASPPSSIRSEPPLKYASDGSRSSLSSPPKRSRRRVNILVFGSTGVGKSTFIRVLVNRGGSRTAGPRQGHSLESCTSEYEGFLFTTPDGQEVMLFDTPGFDDSRVSDAENLADLAKCLQRLLKQGQRIDGVIFINPVTDVRLRGASLKMAEVIKQVCGRAFFQRVGLVTSMWDLVEPRNLATAEHRESMMLKAPQFWGDLHRRNNDFRFENTFSSAHRIVQWLVNQSNLGADGSPILRMSQELQDGRLLSETDAGRFLLGELSKQKEQHDEAVRELRREIAKAQQIGDRATADDFAEEERYERSCAQEAESASQLLHSRTLFVR